MAKNDGRVTTNEVLAAMELQTRLAGVAALVQGRESTGYSSVEFLEKVSKAAGRDSAVLDLLEGLVPPDIDSERWVSWINGGKAPHAVTGPALPRAMSVPQSRLAERALGRASTAREAAAKLETDAAEMLAKAKKLRADDEMESHSGRSLVVVMLMAQLHKRINGVFAMGPAWRLLSIISDLPEAGPFLQDLDALGGDEEFKADMEVALVSVWMKHRARAAASGKRRRVQKYWTSLPTDVTPEEVTDTLRELSSSMVAGEDAGAPGVDEAEVPEAPIKPVRKVGGYDDVFEIVGPSDTVGPPTKPASGDDPDEEEEMRI
jgi:hypothetical protein